MGIRQASAPSPASIALSHERRQMTGNSSALHVVHGDDANAARAIVTQLQAEHAASDPSGLNATTLDGERVTVGEVITACDALPFFGDGRFVLARGLLAKFLAAPEGQRRR